MTKSAASDMETIIEHESAPFWAAINQEDDLSCVLIAVSYLEQCLESSLRRLLIDHSVTNQVVGLMQIKRKMDTLFCLGHLPLKVKDEIVILADIRNHFAHSHFKASFSDKEVIDCVGKLSILSSVIKDTSPRSRFVISAVNCSQIIQVHSLSIQQPSILAWGGI